MAKESKRMAVAPADQPAQKKQKTKKQWQVPRKNAPYPSATIEPGDAGIWATCDRGKEAKSVVELRDLFQEYAEKLYGVGTAPKSTDDKNAELDIEADIAQEVQNIRKPAEKPLFTSVKIDVKCVLFFKTRAPVEPVSFVEAICRDALGASKKRTRFVRRLTPMTEMGKATETGLDGICNTVLPPVFGNADDAGKKFAIRPTLRNHREILNRDMVIKQIAHNVGPNHKVDLTHPEYSILVEVFQKICGMSVVGSEYDKLKRFNLAELYQPSSPKTGNPAEVAEVAETGQDVDEEDDSGPEEVSLEVAG